jgi:hypothetical protein
MRGNNVVREEKIAPCLIEKKRTVHVKCADDKFHCLSCAKKRVKQNENTKV